MRYKDNEETTHFEASRTPINKLDRTLRFDARNCRRRVLGHNVAAVKQAHGHCQCIQIMDVMKVGIALTVLSVLRVTFYLFTPHLAKGTEEALEEGVPSDCHSRSTQKSSLPQCSARVTPSPRRGEERRLPGGSGYVGS